jgi:hypothetical protein
MVAAHENPNPNSRNSTRQSTTRRRRAKSRTDEQAPSLASETYQVGDTIIYTHMPDRPMQITEIIDDRFKIKRLHDGAEFYVYRSLVVRDTQKIATQPPEVTETEVEQAIEGEDQCTESGPIFSTLQSGGWVQIKPKTIKAVRQRLIEHPELATEFHGGDRPEWKIEADGQYLRWANYGDAIVPIAHWDGKTTAMSSNMGTRKVEAFLRRWLEATEPPAQKVEPPPHSLEPEQVLQPHSIESESSQESVILPSLPSPHEIAMAIALPSPYQTIQALLSHVEFWPVLQEDLYPDGEPELYRGWQIVTESREGALMALNISDGEEWWSLPNESDDWFFGWRGHQQAIDWAKQVIDCLVDAAEQASGQLSLLEVVNDADNSQAAIIETPTQSITTLEAAGFKVGDRVAVKYIPGETWQGKDLQGRKIKYKNGDLATIEAFNENESYTVRFDAGGVLNSFSRQLEAIAPQSTAMQKSSTLDTLITEINTLYGQLERAEQVAVSAARSALEFAKEMGGKLLEAKKVAGHGNWEKVREQILSPRTGRAIPSSTATLYQRIFERWEELETNAVATIREASEALKKPRLKSANVAEMQPVVYEKSLVDSLEGLQANFQERKAAANATEDKYRLVEDVTVPPIEELINLYQQIGDTRPTRDGKGFAVLRPDLGNPFPLLFRSRIAAWDYWIKHKGRLLELAERKPKPGENDREIVPVDRISTVNQSNGWIYTTDGQHLNPQHYKPEVQAEEATDFSNHSEILQTELNEFDINQWLDNEFTQSIELLNEWLEPDEINAHRQRTEKAVLDLGGLPVAILAVRDCNKDDLLQLQQIVNRLLELENQ